MAGEPVEEKTDRSGQTAQGDVTWAVFENAKGEVWLSKGSLEDFIQSYRLAEYAKDDPLADSPLLIGARRTKDGYSALVRAEDAERLALPMRKVNLEEIMVHLEKEA